MKRFTIIFVSAFAVAACAAEAPGDGGGGGGDNTGGGGGGGDGSGSGSGSGTGGGGTGGSMTATKFLEEINKKFCDEAHTCKTSFPTDWGVTFDQAFGASPTACYADAAASVMPAAVEAAITAGKINYNAADAAACVSGVTFGTCTEFWNDGGTFPAACDTAMVGTVADGGACTTHIECTGAQSYCDETSSKCTPDAAGARTLPNNDEPWHTQTSVLLKSAN